MFLKLFFLSHIWSKEKSRESLESSSNINRDIKLPILQFSLLITLPCPLCEPSLSLVIPVRLHWNVCRIINESIKLIGLTLLICLFSCNYDPPGNYLNEEIDNVRPAIKKKYRPTPKPGNKPNSKPKNKKKNSKPRRKNQRSQRNGRNES